jgi:hypothetical protein
MAATISPTDFRRHYFGMVGVTALILTVILVALYLFPQRGPYIQYLADYSFEFVRRGFAGEIASFAFPQISQLTVSIIGTFAVLIAAGLYLLLFRRDFGFCRKTVPLLAFVVCSPFTFKMFIRHLGFFDVFGFIVACCALLVPVGRLYPAVFTAASVMLVLTHHIHFLLYVPVIGFICLLRYVIARNQFSTLDAVYVGGCVLTVCLTFLAVLEYGGATVPREVFLEHMRSRALDPFDEMRIDMWYRTLDQEIGNTAARLGTQALYLPIYFLLLFIHLPLIEFFSRSVRMLSSAHHRLIGYAGFTALTMAYIPIFVVVFDYIAGYRIGRCACS